MSSYVFGSLGLVALFAGLLYLSWIARQRFARRVFGVGIVLVFFLAVIIWLQPGSLYDFLGESVAANYYLFSVTGAFTLAGLIGIITRKIKSPRKRKIFSAVLTVTGIFGAIAFIVLGYPIAVVLNMFLFPAEGRFDRSRMESLVSQVRQQSFTGEKDFSWKRDAKGNAVLVATTPNERPTIFARRDKGQHLTVVIETAIRPHDTAFGFAYSDAPFAILPDNPANPDPPGVCELNLPGPMDAARPKKKIDAHWWPVNDNTE